VTDGDHPVDDALRQVAGQPVPSETERQLGVDQLAAAIAAEQANTHDHRRGRMVLWAAALIVILAGIGIAVEALRPTAVEAAIGEIAAAAEEADPLEIPAGEYAYTRTDLTGLAIVPAEALTDNESGHEFLAYLLPAVRETWMSENGTVQIRTTNQTPAFFTTEDETAYYQNGLDQLDAIGVPTIFTTTDGLDEEDWPTDENELDAAIRIQMTGDRELPETVEYLDVALDILTNPLTTPGLRAATLRLIAALPDLETVTTPARSRSSAFAIEYEDDGIQTEQTFTLDPDGYLLEHRIDSLEPDPRYGIPADTTIYDAQYDRPALVTGLNYDG